MAHPFIRLSMYLSSYYKGHILFAFLRYWNVHRTLHAGFHNNTTHALDFAQFYRQHNIPHVYFT